jgi:phage terminase small subunit
MDANNMAISDKQQVFIDEYLICLNASEAARRAGYKGKANVVGPRLLANVSIKDEIDRRLKEKHLTADMVLARLAEQAKSEHSQYINENGTIDLFGLIKDGKSYLIKGTKWDTHGHLIVEFYDAQSALVHIGKYYNLFTDRVEHSGPGGGPIPYTKIIMESPNELMDDNE